MEGLRNVPAPLTLTAVHHGTHPGDTRLRSTHLAPPPAPIEPAAGDRGPFPGHRPVAPEDLARRLAQGAFQSGALAFRSDSLASASEHAARAADHVAFAPVSGAFARDHRARATDHLAIVTGDVAFVRDEVTFVTGAVAIGSGQALFSTGSLVCATEPQPFATGSHVFSAASHVFAAASLVFAAASHVFAAASLVFAAPSLVFVRASLAFVVASLVFVRALLVFVFDPRIRADEAGQTDAAHQRRRSYVDARAPASRTYQSGAQERGMKQEQSYVRDTLVNVQRFLDANAAALGPVNTSGARKALDDAVAALSDHAVAQGEHLIGSTGETQKQRSLRLALRAQYLRPIAKVAAARLSDVPEIATLRLPSFRMVGSELVDAATAMANAATPYVGTFTAAGLKPDFLDGLRALTQQLSASLGGRTDHVLKRRGSTIALRSGTTDGRKALNLLDAAIQQQAPGDAQLLAEWKAVRRIPKTPRSAATAQPGVVATPAAPSPAPVTLSIATPTPAVPAAA